MNITTQNIKLTRADILNKTARSVWQVFALDTYNGGKVYLGTITSWETYIWSIDSPYCPMFTNDSRTRKDAIARMVEDYNNR